MVLSPMFFPVVFFSGPGIEVASLPELGPGGSWSNLEDPIQVLFRPVDG